MHIDIDYAGKFSNSTDIVWGHDNKLDLETNSDHENQHTTTELVTEKQPVDWMDLVLTRSFKPREQRGMETQHTEARANTQVRPYNTRFFVGADLRVCPSGVASFLLASSVVLNEPVLTLSTPFGSGEAVYHPHTAPEQTPSPFSVTTLDQAVDIVYSSSMRERVGYVAKEPELEGKIRLRRDAYPSLKSNGIPLDAVIRQIQHCDAFEQVEQELSVLFSPEDLHVAMTFVAELLFPNVPRI